MSGNSWFTIYGEDSIVAGFSILRTDNEKIKLSYERRIGKIREEKKKGSAFSSVPNLNGSATQAIPPRFSFSSG